MAEAANKVWLEHGALDYKECVGEDLEAKEGGEEVQCGWVTDKHGLSWQIVPAKLSQYLDPSTPERAARALNAVWGMVKLDIAAIEAAYSGNE